MGAGRLKAGDVVGQKYKVEKPIGAGAFASVYVAQDLKVGRRVALKVLDTQMGDIFDRFRHELEAVKNLEHQNIVRLYDFDRTQAGAPCIVMEYIEGEELGELVFEERGFALVRVADIAAQILDALVDAHSQGIVHCDLKPENVLITSKGARGDVAKVLDFGIATLSWDEQQGDGGKQIVGTPHYMAPEQIKRKNIGPWTDLYAVGLIMIEMATGERAVDGHSPQEILRKQLNESVKIPEALAGTELGAIIERAVQKHPERRFRSAKEMYDDIQRALSYGTSSPQWGKIFAGIVEESRHPLKAPTTDYPDDILRDANRSGDYMAQLNALVEEEGQGKPAPGTTTGPSGRARERAAALRERVGKGVKVTERAPERIKPAVRSDKLELDEKVMVKARHQRQGQVFDQRQVHKKRGLRLLMVLSLALLLLLGGVGFFLYHLSLKSVPEESAKSRGEKVQGGGVKTGAPPPKVVLGPADVAAGMVSGTTFAAAQGRRSGETVLFRIIAAPLESDVWRDDVRVCAKTPCSVRVFASAKKGAVRVSRRGFEPLTIALDGAKPDEPILVELEPLVGP